VAGSCGDGNDQSGSIKGRQSQIALAPQEGFCYVELRQLFLTGTEPLLLAAEAPSAQDNFSNDM
jgi:hypothetical protein